MGAFTGVYDELIVRIPPASPSRRDYQLRSVSPNPSRPQSPWRPRDMCSPRGSQEIDTFRLYEAHPAAGRSNYYSGPLPSAPQGSSFYSGPLPSAPQGVDRSYYSGPLPTISPPSQPCFSGPLSGFSTTTTESFDFEFATWAKIYHRQHDSNSVPGSPEVGSRAGSRAGSSSQEGKFVRRRNCDDDGDSADDEPSSFYLSNPAESRARANAEFAERAGKYGVARNCVSGELGVCEAIAKQKSQAARGYKSGEILGLNICADGIYHSSPPAAEVVEAPGERQHNSGPTAAWDALMKDAKNDMNNGISSRKSSENSNCDSEMVAIPFKWEDVSGKGRDSVSKKPNSRTSSASTKPNSRTSSTAAVSQKPNSRTSSTSSVSHKANARSSSTSGLPQKPNSRTSSTSTASQKPNSRTLSTSTVSQKANSRTPSASTVAKKPNWNTSTTATQEGKVSGTGGRKSLKSEFSFGGSHKFDGGGEKAFEKAESVCEEAENVKGSHVSVADVVAPPALKPLKTTAPSRKVAQQQELEEAPKSPFSVPFKWEEEPGKAKFELEDKAKSEEAPALQLPPRLVSASVKRSQPAGTPTIRSPTSSTKASKTPTKQSQSGWASEPESTSSYVESVGKQQSRQGSGIASSKKFFDKDCFRRCRRLLVNLF